MPASEPSLIIRPSISGVTWDGQQTDLEFVAMVGVPQPAAMLLEELTRPGVNGHAYRQLGRRSPISYLTVGRDFEDPGNCTTLRGQLLDLQGQVVTITDAHGRVHTHVMLLRVEILEEREILSGSGGLAETPTFWGEYRLEVQMADDTTVVEEEEAA